MASLHIRIMVEVISVKYRLLIWLEKMKQTVFRFSIF